MMLEQDMADNEAQTITRSLAARPYIKTIHFISKKAALRDAAKQMGTDPSTFTDGVNPFSSSIELTLKSDYANNDSLVWISRELKKYPKVSDITFHSVVAGRDVYLHHTLFLGPKHGHDTMRGTAL